MLENDNLASWPIRGAAYLIDVITPAAGLSLFAFGGAVAIGVGMGDAIGPEGVTRPQAPVWLAPLILAGAIIIIGYAVWWFIALKDGQTPGKKIVGIRVVSASTGETRGWGIMLVRELLTKFIFFGVIFELTPIGTFLDFFFGFFLPFDMLGFFGVSAILPLALMINFLWPLWDANSQALHDKIVGTHVVRA